MWLNGKLKCTLLAMTLSFLLIFQVQAESRTNLPNKRYQGANWVLNNLQGEPVELSNFQGQPVILVFWATWCPYCKKLLPGVEKLHQKYANKGLKIIAVNILEDWKPKAYWRNHEYSFEAVLAGDDVAKTYGVKGTPGVVFIAPNGEVLNVDHFSDPNHPSLEKFARHYLK